MKHLMKSIVKSSTSMRMCLSILVIGNAEVVDQSSYQSNIHRHVQWLKSTLCLKKGHYVIS